MKAINLLSPLNIPIPPTRDYPNLYSWETLTGVKEVKRSEGGARFEVEKVGYPWPVLVREFGKN